MKLEKKIYDGYAFTEDQNEKGEINAQIRKELAEKNTFIIYPLYHNGVKSEFDFENYDIVLTEESGYAHTKYVVYQNRNNLSMTELGLLAGRMNLCFGMRTEGENVFCVHTD